MMDQFNLQHQMNEGPKDLEHPQQAEDLCTRILQTAAELISVLDRETGQLRKGDAQELNTIFARKTALSTAMMRDMATLNANASYICRVVPEQIEALKDQYNQFQRSLRINHEALGAVKAISENLMRTIANAAGTSSAGPEVYGQSAAMSGYNNSGTRPAALSVNRSL